MKFHSPVKTGYYILEGSNSFATAYYFNYLMVLLHREHGFSSFQNLAVGAIHGFIYVAASWFAGRFGQKYGYFTSLRIGFLGMALSLACGWIFPSVTGQITALLSWTMTICFTWPMLEALVAEHEPPDRLPGRIGLYNVVWASSAAAAVFFGGSLFERLGPASLYWLPLILQLAHFAGTFFLEKRHINWLATSSSPLPPSLSTQVSRSRPDYFKTLSWIGNPFAYMAGNTLVAVVPSIAAKVGLTIEQAGQLMALWYIIRTLTFAILWQWHGWHYRITWFLGAFVLLIVGFVSVMITQQIWILVVGQILFGWATGLLYHSSLFYAMDGSETKGEHGGIHEAFIGLGIGGGPAISTLTLWISGSPHAPALAVGVSLLAGLVVSIEVWRRSNSTKRSAP